MTLVNMEDGHIVKFVTHSKGCKAKEQAAMYSNTVVSEAMATRGKDRSSGRAATSVEAGDTMLH